MWDRLNVTLQQAADRVSEVLVELLPGLLALVVIWAATLVVAALIRGVLRHTLRRLNFDAGVQRVGFGWLVDWSPANSPSALMGRVIFWVVGLMGFVLGLSAFGGEVTDLFVVRLFGYLPNVVAAVAIMAAGSLLARFLSRGVLISAVNMQIQSAQLMSLGVKWLILVLAAAMALDHLSIGGPIVPLAFGILFGGIVLALALAVGLGSREAVGRALEQQTGKKPDDPVHHV